ncbi:MAG: Vitamin B12 dependent methionine synthase activation subunit [Lachnospiraceae bacterium]|nr:Vitamin B12 dependent methionine synthase activation subunit [Lachnospiraceae bacterium]
MITAIKVTYTNEDIEPVDRDEVLRYAGMGRSVDETLKKDIYALLSDCVKEAEKVINYGLVYCDEELVINNGGILSPLKTGSKNLLKNLEGCNRCVLFAATLGMGIDRLIIKYEKLSPVKALVFQALGAERAEALCNRFCKDLKAKYGEKNVKPRFSPGFGDLPLSHQKDFFNILNPVKYLSLTLNESFLMSPSKSVTAVVGIKSGEI